MSSQPMLFGDEATAAPAEPKPEAQKRSFWDEHVEPAMGKAEQNADERWKRVAAECIEQIARKQHEFTSDDVVELLEALDVRTHNLAALGPLFLKANKQGLIKNTGRMERTRIARRHRKITVWESCLLESAG